MSALLCATILGFQYGFAPGMKLEYETSIELSGFIPIFGGTEGTALVNIDLSVLGLEGKTGKVSASSEITGFRATFNEANIPLDVSSVQSYFPKTTIHLLSHGKIIESDAPDIKLPIRLPGLDVKRFPDITYVPVEFPEKGVEVGDTWTFIKMFGESEIKYACRLVSMNSGDATIEVSLEQEFEMLEDAALEVTTVQSEAERKVKSTMTGTGTVIFDTARGVVRKAHVVNKSVSEVTELSDGSKSTRKLTTTFDIKLKEAVPHRVLESRNFLSTARSTWSRVFVGAQLAWQFIVRGFGG